ncbi:MAG: hypothetical protein Q8K65_01560 [Alphaproteobacteria bacterium]|nr:hypothetical protein [Alphaproteobacteria bacterium]
MTKIDIPAAAGDAPVLLYHGTSEGHLAALLQNGFTRRPRTALDSVRDVIGHHLPGRDIDDDFVQEVMRKGSRLLTRSDESNGGRSLFATPHPDTAADYAAQHAAHGGEFGYGVHQALRDMGHGDLPPRFADARPVLLTLHVPAGDLHLEKGMALSLADGAQHLKTSHEVFINDNRHIHIKSVTFAKPQGSGWTFDGQPALTAQQAAAEIAAPFANASKFLQTPQGAPPDALTQEIAAAVYLFRHDPAATTEHVRRKPVATAMAYDAAGNLQKIRIPDPDFEPQATQLAAGGFPAVAQDYTLPRGLGARELDAYLNVLDVRTQHGTITPAQKASAEKTLFTRLTSDNPALAAIMIDTQKPPEVSAALRGVAQGMTPQDIAFNAKTPTAAQGADYQTLKKSAGFHLPWNPAPETVAGIRTEMERKLATRAPAAPAVP